nr:MAG TPA: hypothetical protein [Caudoviricetes sp.]
MHRDEAWRLVADRPALSQRGRHAQSAVRRRDGGQDRGQDQIQETRDLGRWLRRDRGGRRHQHHH